LLDVETRRRIDTARDILVGKVPDPKSQVEQITIALIYKFMWDIEAQSEELGGQRSFFVDDFERFAWPKLLRSGLGGFETLGLYSEALDRIPENPGIPALFRSIFNNAYLPYRDPETLREFLKVIDQFEYDHSERLGDAFEYLLSIMGAQGDAGQFRTPRHIIDFIVEIVNPQLGETVLDPACGTAGFLISAYKHIQRANTDEDGQSTLTPHERGRLAESFTGYDISPDMVRLSLVNMYLHGFVQPDIHEYDTLTSEERWDDYADVILANPPFMSPRGGIRPHSRFSVQSRRSEVLFVDYMAAHLKPDGRAGIIVPEGIIFQSQKAHTQLRKMLVEDYLVAVISLPAGVFKPYSGVKTSILILDRALARHTKHLAFFKVENDGYDLGDQRRPIDQNDLPRMKSELLEYLRRARFGEVPADDQPKFGLVVAKERIAADGGFNLVGDRYLDKQSALTSFYWRNIGSLVETVRPPAKIPKSKFAESGLYPIIDQSQSDIAGWTNDHTALVIPRRPVVIFGDHTCIVKLIETPFAQGADGIKILEASEDIDPRFLYYLLRCRGLQQDGYRRHFSKLKEYEIPVPPLEVQQEFVAEIESYQKVIDGARAVVKNYRPHIPISPDWPIVRIDEACYINPDRVNPMSVYKDQTILYIDISSIENKTGRFLGYTKVLSSEAPTRARRGVRDNDVLLSTVRPNLKAFALLEEVKERAVASTGFAVLRARHGIADPAFIHASICSSRAVEQMVGMMGKGSYPSINQSDVASIRIALPPLSIQQAVVTEIKAEQALVSANQKLAERFERKTRGVIDGVWSQ